MKGSRFTRQIVLLAVLPVVLLFTYFTISSWYYDRKEYYDKTWSELEASARACQKAFQNRHPDWYEIDTVEKAQERDFSFMNVISDISSCEVTIFYGDIRIATTMMDGQGNSQIGTRADEKVVLQVLEGGRNYRAPKMTIADHEYCAYYSPIMDANGQAVGMVFTGKFTNQVQNGLFRTLMSGFVKLLGLAMLLGVLAFFFAKKIIDDLHIIMDYMRGVAKGDFNRKMDDAVLKRNDEFGELAMNAVRVSDAFQNLIQKDPLTGMYNRRACTSKLGKMISKANTPNTEHEPISIAMMDVDFFKKVNDTYGHSMGDEVLKEISAIIQKYVNEVGFVARWGGEEFLLVVPMEINDLCKMLEMICDEIRRKEFTANYSRFSVTVTVGVAQYRSPERMDNVINIADRRLYQGKQAGRNRIVTETK